MTLNNAWKMGIEVKKEKIAINMNETKEMQEGFFFSKRDKN